MALFNKPAQQNSLMPHNEQQPASPELQSIPKKPPIEEQIAGFDIEVNSRYEKRYETGEEKLTIPEFSARLAQEIIVQIRSEFMTSKAATERRAQRIEQNVKRIAEKIEETDRVAARRLTERAEKIMKETKDMYDVVEGKTGLRTINRYGVGSDQLSDNLIKLHHAKANQQPKRPPIFPNDIQKQQIKDAQTMNYGVGGPEDAVEHRDNLIDLNDNTANQVATGAVELRPTGLLKEHMGRLKYLYEHIRELNKQTAVGLQALEWELNESAKKRGIELETPEKEGENAKVIPIEKSEPVAKKMQPEDKARFEKMKKDITERVTKPGFYHEDLLAELKEIPEPKGRKSVDNIDGLFSFIIRGIKEDQEDAKAVDELEEKNFTNQRIVEIFFRSLKNKRSFKIEAGYDLKASEKGGSRRTEKAVFEQIQSWPDKKIAEYVRSLNDFDKQDLLNTMAQSAVNRPIAKGLQLIGVPVQDILNQYLLAVRYKKNFAADMYKEYPDLLAYDQLKNLGMNDGDANKILQKFEHGEMSEKIFAALDDFRALVGGEKKVEKDGDDFNKLAIEFLLDTVVGNWKKENWLGKKILTKKGFKPDEIDKLQQVYDIKTRHSFEQAIKDAEKEFAKLKNDIKWMVNEAGYSEKELFKIFLFLGGEREFANFRDALRHNDALDGAPKNPETTKPEKNGWFKKIFGDTGKNLDDAYKRVQTEQQNTPEAKAKRKKLKDFVPGSDKTALLDELLAKAIEEQTKTMVGQGVSERGEELRPEDYQIDNYYKQLRAKTEAKRKKEEELRAKVLREEAERKQREQEEAEKYSKEQMEETDMLSKKTRTFRGRHLKIPEFTDTSNYDNLDVIINFASAHDINPTGIAEARNQIAEFFKNNNLVISPELRQYLSLHEHDLRQYLPGDKEIENFGKPPNPENDGGSPIMPETKLDDVAGFIPDMESQEVVERRRGISEISEELDEEEEGTVDDAKETLRRTRDSGLATHFESNRYPDPLVIVAEAAKWEALGKEKKPETETAKNKADNIAAEALGSFTALNAAREVIKKIEAGVDWEGEVDTIIDTITDAIDALQPPIGNSELSPEETEELKQKLGTMDDEQKEVLLYETVYKIFIKEAEKNGMSEKEAEKVARMTVAYIKKLERISSKYKDLKNRPEAEPEVITVEAKEEDLLAQTIKGRLEIIKKASFAGATAENLLDTLDILKEIEADVVTNPNDSKRVAKAKKKFAKEIADIRDKAELPVTELRKMLNFWPMRELPADDRAKSKATEALTAMAIAENNTDLLQNMISRIIRSASKKDLKTIPSLAKELEDVLEILKSSVEKFEQMEGKSGHEQKMALLKKGLATYNETPKDKMTGGQVIIADKLRQALERGKTSASGTTETKKPDKKKKK